MSDMTETGIDEERRPGRTPGLSPLGETNETPHDPLGRRFLVVWAGQTVSEVGTMLSGVGAAIYVFVQTGSAAWLGALAAVAALPRVLSIPMATLIDRYPRRSVMIWSDVFAAIGPAGALVLALIGELQIWHLVVAGALGSLGNAFQQPASQAAVPSLAPAGALDRANSLKQLGPAIGLVVGPVLAAPIIAWWGIEVLLTLDLVSFGFGVAAVLAVRFDDHRDKSGVSDDGSWKSAWVWLSTDGRPLLGLMFATAVVNLVLAIFNVAIVALATDVAGVARAGVVLGAGGAAMIVGLLVSAKRGLADDRVGVFVRTISLMSLGIALSAARPSLLWVLFGVVVSLSSVPAINAAITTVYNERVPASMQGRVFALRGSVSQALQPIGALAAGVAITYLAAPAISEGGVLSGSLGRVIGSGPERGTAVVLIACSMALAVLAWLLARSALRVELLRPAVSDEAVLETVCRS